MDGTHLDFTTPADSLFQRGEIIKPVTFGEVAGFLVQGDDRFNRDGAGLRAGARIEGIEWQAGAIVRVLREDLVRLRDAFEAPTCGYPTLMPLGPDGRPVPPGVPLGKAVLPFLDALAAALSPPAEA